MFNSDVLVIGIVFLLLVGSLFFYLYMYVQQVDQKASLLESILLDMKVSHEITSFSSNNESPASSASSSSASASALESANSSLESSEQEKPYTPYSDDKPVAEDTLVSGEAVSLEELEVLKPFQPADELEELEELHDSQLDQPSLNYESMSLKELQSVAKSKGVTGTMKKNQLIETLKGLEQSGLKHGVVGSSFLENSALVSNDV
jgi:cytoskeletal protein RodZ